MPPKSAVVAVLQSQSRQGPQTQAQAADASRNKASLAGWKESHPRMMSPESSSTMMLTRPVRLIRRPTSSTPASAPLKHYMGLMILSVRENWGQGKHWLRLPLDCRIKGPTSKR